MAVLLPNGKQSFDGVAGLPLVGGQVFTYGAGTNTPLPTFSDAAGTIANTNPVILDARGEATIFWKGAYKIVLKDALGITIWTVDNVIAADIDATLRADLAKPSGAALLGYQRDEVGALPTTVDAKLDDLGATLADGGITPSATVNNRAKLQTLINAGNCVLHGALAIDDELIVPDDREITLMPGTRLIWLGAAPTPTGSKGFFRHGDRVKIMAVGIVTAEAAVPSPYLYLTLSLGKRDCELLGHYRGTNISGFCLDSKLGPIPSPGDYNGVVMPAMIGTPKPGGGAYADADVNCSWRNKLGTFDGKMTNTSGPLVGVGNYLRFSWDTELHPGKVENMFANLYWRGGNASFDADAQGGNPANLKKSGKIRSWGGSAFDCETGFWGSMGADVIVYDAFVDGANDVGLDVEGGDGVTYVGCVSKNARNGCATLFYNNRGVRFEACTFIVDKKELLLSRIYNEAASAANNFDATFVGCSFACTDPTGPARVDTDQGPLRSWQLLGCSFNNVIVNGAGCNHVVIKGDMLLPYKAPVATDFVAVRELQGGGNFAAPLAKVEVDLYSQVQQPAGSTAFFGTASDPNSSPDHLITNGSYRMPLDDGTNAGFRVTSAGRGSLAAAYTIRNNELDGPIVARTAPGTPTGIFDIQGNYNARGGVPPMG